jgi:hypothetical protein
MVETGSDPGLSQHEDIEMNELTGLRILELAIQQLTLQIEAIKLGGKPFGSIGGFERDTLVEERVRYEGIKSQIEARLA